MKTNYPIERVPATPEYILACFQEEWRQCAWLEADEPNSTEPQRLTFDTTIREWRDALDLVWWSPLGQALNKAWGTKFSEWRWFSVLVPAREKFLRGVCELLASQARRPLAPPARLLGCADGRAGIFLAVRSLLIQVGAPSDLWPSTPLAPFLKRWPKIFLNEISGLAPGGSPFTFERKPFGKLFALSFVAGVLLLLASSLCNEPAMIIAGVILFAASWLGGLCYRGPLTLENVTTFRRLIELIVEQQRKAGIDPEKS